MHADELFIFKKSLHQHLTDLVKQDIVELQNLIGDLRSSAGSETKSSVGDKYETARAMAHLEIEKLGHQLAEKEKALAVITSFGGNRRCFVGEPGALAESAFGLIYIAIHRGEIHFDNRRVFCVSGASPVAKSLIGKKAGDEFVVNSSAHSIHMIV